MTVKDIPAVNRALKKEFQTHSAPIVELIEAQTHDPFCVLVGTILSARTKDACTAGAVKRLFEYALVGGDDGRPRTSAPTTVQRITSHEPRLVGGDVSAPRNSQLPNQFQLSRALTEAPIETLEKLIYPVGFYHDKARHLKALPGVLQAKFGGILPHTVEELCELPGVGRKTANLTVAVGFDLPAICVDVHVHRICNWLGLVKTKKPVETEMELRRILPVRYWKTWNSHLVSFGQTRCDPVRPKCSGCPIARFCHSPKKLECRIKDLKRAL